MRRVGWLLWLPLGPFYDCLWLPWEERRFVEKQRRLSVMLYADKDWTD